MSSVISKLQFSIPFRNSKKIQVKCQDLYKDYWDDIRKHKKYNGDKIVKKREAFINLFKYAQQYYGQKVKQVNSIRIQLALEPDPATIKWDYKFYIQLIRYFLD